MLVPSALAAPVPPVVPVAPADERLYYLAGGRGC